MQKEGRKSFAGVETCDSSLIKSCCTVLPVLKKGTVSGSESVSESVF
jgi:hypothetical protein